MLFDEYIKIFEEVLSITEKIAALCSKMRSEETEPLFNKRNQLMQKLSIPEDIDDEKFKKVIALKEKITSLNEKILKDLKKEKDLAKKNTTELQNNISAQIPSQIPSQMPKIQLENNFKNPKPNNGGSIFS